MHGTPEAKQEVDREGRRQAVALLLLPSAWGLGEQINTDWPHVLLPLGSGPNRKTYAKHFVCVAEPSGLD